MYSTGIVLTLKSIDHRLNKILASWAAEDERSARCAAKWQRQRHLARWAAEDERSARRKAKRKRQATAVSAAKRERQATASSDSVESDDEVQLVQTLGVVEPKGGTLTKPNPKPILTLNVT
jgi:hypothetical protein